MSLKDYRKHEVNFCSEVSKWADSWFQSHSTLPFGSSEIEEFAKGTAKRSDLRIYERKDSGRGKLLVSGEVKLPGTPLGRSAFDPALMQDAFDKATRENCRYFFTWNVEEWALFDRSLWDAPTMHERLVGHWRLGLRLNSPSDITLSNVKHKIFSEFLPKVIADIGEIVRGKTKGDFSLAPSDFYIAVLESHLTGPLGPVRELLNYLLLECDRDTAFDSRLRAWMVEQQWNFDRKDQDSWKLAIGRAADSMVYVLSNRILFYQAVRLRNYLPQLDIPKGANTPKLALKSLKRHFQEAVDATGDYEPIFFPDEDQGEWAAVTALSGTNSLDAWRKYIEAVEKFQFKEIPTDVLGGVFQKLISPEERHKFGQHYTDENIVDVINAFCIRKGSDVVLDPACGSGGFLVRAYYRKTQLDGHLSHEEAIEQLYGCDINPFPAHLATLNLAARNISNRENYPRIARKNFFRIRRDARAFCVLPKATRDSSGQRERETIELPELDSIVGNPPYVRQELIPRQDEKGVIADQTKEYILHASQLAFPELRLSGQSDLHLYFWPVATQFLREGGWFGFLTSSSWLDVRCDAFFMPRDVSKRVLGEYESTMEWQTAPLMQRPKRSEVASGKVLIIEAGDKTLHPIEKKYIRPELHSLMKVHRPVVKAEGLDRVVLWVDQPLEEIKGTYAYDYIRWGSKQTFASKKSKPTPVPQRPTCAARELWYDVTGLKPGVAFWPMAQQYRHIVAANPERLACNHNLFDLHPFDDSHEKALIAVLNSTLVALIKTFYGRYAGTEGNLKTEVIDVLTLEVPNPAEASTTITERLSQALERLQTKESGQLLEERLRNCHTAADVRLAAKEPLGLPKELQRQDRRELDDAVFELLGVADPKRRSELIDRLYRELTLHNRNIRIIEVQKMEQRRKSGTDKVSHLQLVVDAWENLEPEWRKPLPVWLKENVFAAKTVDLPEGEVRLAAAENFLEADTLFFGKKPGLAHQCDSRAEAELLYQIAHEGLRGPVSIPSGEAQTRKLSNELEHRLVEGCRKLIHLAEERAGTDKLREQVVETLYRWFIHGVPEAGPAQSAGA